MRRFYCVKSEGRYKGWRCWFHPFTASPKRDKWSLNLELYLWTDRDMPGFQFNASADCENTAGFNINVPFLFSLYVSADLGMVGYSNWWRKLLRLDDEHRYEGRSWGIRYIKDKDCIDAGYLNIELGRYDNSWSSRDPKWYSMSIHPRVVLCGKTTYTEEDKGITEHKVLIKGSRGYPDKEYMLSCKEYISKWTWKRFKKPHLLKRYTVECMDKNGVPHPGKGTTSYNCEETALHSQSGPANSREEAIQKFVDSVNWYRANYPL